MLKVEAIRELATRHPLKITTHYAEYTTRSSSIPKPSLLTIWFKEDDPDVWETLMTNRTEVPVTVSGTRQMGVSSSDNRLKPVYAERLDRVNMRRAELGLARVLD